MTITTWIDVVALAARAEAVLAEAAGHVIVDLRRDAWGHGLDLVAPILADVGVRAARTDADARPVAAAAGLTTTAAEPTVDGRFLFGLPDAPVMHATGRVLSTKTLRAGEGVSYGYSHRAPRDTRIALVSGGYAHGIVRALGNRVTVAVSGERRPIVGRVAMDVCVVDIGDADVHPGTEVTYFGGAASLSEWEAATGMTAEEMVCAVGLRAHRRDAR
ncbi:alanine racemase [Microbacterium koreense]|uniref:Alanine racemase n=1 Tax=Microbacterium koreense TaxID=323761 RepID=A0ABW2ZME1_9MICO